MKTHHLKTWPAYFKATFEGKKDFDIRKDDRSFDVGDFLILAEYDQRTGEFTGRAMGRRIESIVYGGPKVEGRPGVPDPTGGLREGYVILGHSYAFPSYGG